jgi:hypothetical protein
MTKITNQDRERHYFERFRKVYSLPQGSICYSDRPDIIIKGREWTGVEVTDFYIEEGSLPESEQAQITFRDRVVSNAQKIYQNDNGKNIHITFGFNKANPIREKKKLEMKLVDLAKHIESQETRTIPLETFRTIPELSFVYLNKEYQNGRWRVQQVYRGSNMSRDRLLQIVRYKEEKAKEYQKCDAYWLLIVVDFFDPAQDQEIPGAGFDKIETEIFEKVIVYKTAYEKTLEVK